jgi:hypothetical protein
VSSTAALALATSRAPLAIESYYEYICQLADGNSWSLSSGEPTDDCHGTYLQKYINGSMVANYNLTLCRRQRGQHPPGYPVSDDCALALFGTVGLVLFPPTGAVAWVYLGTIQALGIGLCIAE